MKHVNQAVHYHVLALRCSYIL